MPSGVSLASIPALTFYSGVLTESRRTSPIPQLRCIGRPCNLFQPDVVRCVNEGGHGTDVDWRCEADLPASLRFGRVEVSCEGWSGPGDHMVLKGSCGLEYRLVRVPHHLQDEDPYNPSSLGSLFHPDNALKMIFLALWTIVLLFFLYTLLKSCLTRTPNPTPARPGFWPSGAGWFQGYHSDNADNPPPYSRYGKRPASRSDEGWRPGFWTGLGLGGLGATLWGRRRDPYIPPQRSRWDWERPSGRWGSTAGQTAPVGGWFQSTENASRRSHTDDRGEGSSNLGITRRSMGWGGSRVR